MKDQPTDLPRRDSPRPARATPLTTLRGPAGRAVQYRYAARRHPQSDFWLVEQADAGVVLHVTHHDLSAAPWAQTLASLSWCAGMAYVLNVSECWGTQPCVTQIDSYDDLSDPVMQCAYPTAGAGNAHATLLVQDLISGHLDLLGRDAMPPTPLPSWDAYWTDLQTRAEHAPPPKEPQ